MNAEALGMEKEMQKEIIRVLIVESHEIIRLGLRTLFESQPLLHIVAETGYIDDAFNLAVKHTPDVILLEWLLNDDNCAEHIPKLLDVCLQSKILIFSSSNEEQNHIDLLGLGVAGIVGKHQSTKLLLKAIHAVHDGEVWFDKNITKLLWQAQLNQPQSNFDVAKIAQQPLSKRECNVACLASKGLSAKKVGEQLFISEKTVRNQLTAIYEKLNVSSQVELCLKSDQLGYCQCTDKSRNRDICPL